MNIRDLGNGKGIRVKGMSDAAAKHVAVWMTDNGITTEADKRRALSRPETLAVLVELFMNDAIEIVDLNTLEVDPGTE